MNHTKEMSAPMSRQMLKQLTSPVSEKAYADFIGRITAVMGDPVRTAAMIAALNRYLSGDKDYDRGLDPTCRPAFGILRCEIDRAIARSRRARERREQRHTPAPASCRPQQRQHSLRDIKPDGLNVDNPVTPTPAAAPTSRRQRRADARDARPKSRWKPLGTAAPGTDGTKAKGKPRKIFDPCMQYV